jgi:hypothetical protein
LVVIGAEIPPLNKRAEAARGPGDVVLERRELARKVLVDPGMTLPRADMGKPVASSLYHVKE